MCYFFYNVWCFVMYWLTVLIPQIKIIQILSIIDYFLLQVLILFSVYLCPCMIIFRILFFKKKKKSNFFCSVRTAIVDREAMKTKYKCYVPEQCRDRGIWGFVKDLVNLPAFDLWWKKQRVVSNCMDLSVGCPILVINITHFLLKW